jgi:hypothetical protein
MKNKLIATTGEIVTIFLFGMMIGILCMMIAGCQEFTNADSKIEAKDSAYSHIDMDSSVDVKKIVERDTSNISRDSSNIFAEALPKDSSKPIESELPIRNDGGHSECDNCPPQPFGRESCCTIYQTCGYRTTLGNCTDGHI